MSITRGWRSSLLRHTSRAHRAAIVDRYDTIRTFFSQEFRTLSSRPKRPTESRYTVEPQVRLTLQAQDTRPYFRHISATAYRRVEHRHDVQTGDKSSGDSPRQPTGKAGPLSQNEPGSEELGPRRFENYSRFFRKLAMSLPHLHRPTRDDFLNATTGFWQRARVRFKWLTIRSFRKYNADEISAFVTWFFMSQTLWLFVGT